MKKFLVILSLVGLAVSCSNSINNKENTVQTDKKDTSNNELNSPALKALNEYLKSNPNNPSLYYKRGLIYLDFKDFEAAIADANRALKIDSLTNDSFYILLTDASFYAGQTRLSKETLERCIKNLPNSTQAYLKLAELFFYVKKYQESITNINNALKINPSLAKGYFLKGMCYKESGDTTLALTSMQTACEQDDKYYDAFVECGRLLAAKRNLLCIEYYNKALKINQTPEVVYLVGKFYQDNGRIPQAVDAYNKLLTLDKKYKNAFYNLGAINYIYIKDLDKAKDYFSEAINIDPDYAEAYLARGICFEDQKNLTEAEADYKMAVQAKPNYDEALIRLNSIIEKRKGH